MRCGNVAGTVNLGITEDCGVPFLSRLMRVVDNSFPGIELTVTCQMSVRLQKLLEVRKLDLAIVTLRNQKSHSTMLSQPKLVWVASGDYIIDRKKAWPMAFTPKAARSGRGGLRAEGARQRLPRGPDHSQRQSNQGCN